MTMDKVKSSFSFDPQSHVRPFLASTTALLSLVMATSMVMRATPAQAGPIETGCTVTADGGTLDNPNNGSTITCSGTHSETIGSAAVDDLTVQVGVGATLNSSDSPAIRANQGLNLTNYGTITKYSHYLNLNYDPTISVFAPSTIANFGTIQNSGYGTAISIGSSYVPPTENHSGYYHSSQTTNDGTIIGGTSSAL